MPTTEQILAMHRSGLPPYIIARATTLSSVSVRRIIRHATKSGVMPSDPDSGGSICAHDDVFQERLRAARNLREWSQEQFAAAAGMPPSSIGHYEAGSRKPSFDTLLKLANALEVTTDYLLGRVEEPSLGEADPLYRDVGKLTAADRDMAKDFLKMLVARNQAKKRL